MFPMDIDPLATASTSIRTSVTTEDVSIEAHLTTPTNCTSESVPISQEFIIGLILAVSSSLFIGTSFILKKKGLLRVSRSSTERAGKGGYAYLKEWMWWAGLITMAVGEAANFTAYGFAPAILVTPLGALSVLVSAVLSSQMLNEKLNIHGKLGCMLSILGSTVIIIHAPEEGFLEDLAKIGWNLLSFGFLLYSSIAIGLSIYLIFWVAPIKGQTNILVYIAICSLIGSLTVVGCKGLSIAIKLTIAGQSQFKNPLAWFFLIAVATCITIQMNYLNKSLDIFNTSLVTPLYYVMFTTLTITASAILFKEWERLTGSDIVGALCGFLIIVCGVFLLHAFKDINFTLKDLFALTNNQEPGQDTNFATIILDSTNRTLSASNLHSPSWRDGNESGTVEECDDEPDTSETDKFIPLSNRT